MSNNTKRSAGRGPGANKPTRVMRTRTERERREDLKEFRRGIEDVAKAMGGRKVPRAYWCPGPSKWLSAGQMAQALRTIAAADPGAEFRQSFSNWYPLTAEEIRRREVVPALHERINARGVMDAKQGRP